MVFLRILLPFDPISHTVCQEFRAQVVVPLGKLPFCLDQDLGSTTEQHIEPQMMTFPYQLDILTMLILLDNRQALATSRLLTSPL